jgi:acetyltransferase-like isoleucine patch superfamily enzyme
MLDVLQKAFWVLRKRPLHFLGIAGQYWRFSRARLYQRLFFQGSETLKLGKNVRIQAVSCLSAEKPAARIEIGDDTIIYEKARVEAYGQGRIQIGEGCILGEVRLYSRLSVKLGNRVVTSWNVFIQDFDPHPVEPELRKLQMEHMVENFRPSYRARRQLESMNWDFPTAAIEIGDDVWLGANCTILKGARIGAGSVVATGSVVTAGDYPPRSILAGTPARVVKTV